MESRWSQELYIRAYRYATKAHHGQCVPGSDFPYITHLSFVSMEIVASLSIGNKRNGDLAVQCSLLHDTIEDTVVTYEQVKDKFGIDVADGVQALTKDFSIKCKSEQMKDSLMRIRKQPIEVWMVKMADRITNLQPPPPHWNNEKKKKYREEAKEIYKTLKDADEYLALRLKKKIEDYKNYIYEK